MNLINTQNGDLFEYGKIKIFFGNINSNTDVLSQQFSEFTFKKIKQVHGDVILETKIDSELTREADAHYTQEKNLAMSIFTADCTPAFLFTSDQKFVASIHAGWRGMALSIIPKTIELLKKKSNLQIEDIHIVYGPHIQKNSFQIQTDCLNQLLATIPKDFHKELYTQTDDFHFQFDLNKLLKVQLQQLNVPAENIQGLFADTVTNPNYHSYRRDKSNSGRNLSWIGIAV